MLIGIKEVQNILVIKEEVEFGIKFWMCFCEYELKKKKKKIYTIFSNQRGTGLMVKRQRRCNQRSHGFLGGLAKIGRKIIKSGVVKKVLKDVVMPIAMDAMAKRAS